MIKNRVPFLKELTTLSNALEDVDDDVESTNFLESLDHLSKYIVFNDFLTAFLDYFDLVEEDVEIGEGFVSREICEEYELEPTTEEVHEFNSILFRCEKIALSTKKVLAVLDEMVYYKELMKSIEIDVSSGWIQVIINEDSMDECKVTLGS